MRVITVDINKTVVSVKNVGDNYVLQSDDLVSKIGDIGQIQQIDGSFITPTPTVVPQPYEPTNSEIAQMISDLQADLIIAGVI